MFCNVKFDEIIFVLLQMKVKSDHRSIFFDLSNWKEEAWKKNQGFFFFRLLLSYCLNWKIYCDDHSSLSCFAMFDQLLSNTIEHGVQTGQENVCCFFDRQTFPV